MGSSVKMLSSSLKWFAFRVCCVRVHVANYFIYLGRSVCNVRNSVRVDSLSSNVNIEYHYGGIVFEMSSTVLLSDCYSLVLLCCVSVVVSNHV